MHNKNQNTCSFLRRLCAIFYDTILLSSVLFFATFALIPFLGGNAINSDNLIYKIYLFLLTYLYFVWQWCFGSKTLGMRSWQIKVINHVKKKESVIVKAPTSSGKSFVAMATGIIHNKILYVCA